MANSAAAAGPISQGEFEEMMRNFQVSLCPCPVSTQELLCALEKAESALSCVGQHPPASMVDAISPLSGILLLEEVLEHPDGMVGITALSCLCQIMRISVPNAPYDFEEMKKIFSCFIAAFEKLPDVVSPCYQKTAKVLKCLAEIRGFVILLDIDYVLAINVFQLLPKVIRTYHPHSLFLSIQDIMVQLIKECDEVSLDFMLPLLDGLKMKLQDTAPISSLLVHLVLEKCADRLYPHIREAKETLKLNLEEYSETVQLIWQEVPEEQNMAENAGVVSPGKETSAAEIAQVQVPDSSNNQAEQLKDIADTPADPVQVNTQNLQQMNLSGLSENMTPDKGLKMDENKNSVEESADKTERDNEGKSCVQEPVNKNEPEKKPGSSSEKVASEEKPEKLSISDVLSPNTASPGIGSGGPRRRGRPRKNQSNPKVKKGSEETSSSIGKQARDSCEKERDNETKASVEEPTDKKEGDDGSKKCVEEEPANKKELDVGIKKSIEESADMEHGDGIKNSADKKELEKQSGSSSEKTTSKESTLPSETEKQSIPDVLSPNTASTGITPGSSRRRGRPRKNQSDPKVEKGSEGTSSKGKRGRDSCERESENQSKTSVEEPAADKKECDEGINKSVEEPAADRKEHDDGSKNSVKELADKMELEKKSCSLSEKAASKESALPSETGKQYIADVLSPNIASTVISSGSSRKRGRPRKNQSDPNVKKGSEETSSIGKQGRGSCKEEGDNENKTFVEESAEKKENEGGIKNFVEETADKEHDDGIKNSAEEPADKKEPEKISGSSCEKTPLMESTLPLETRKQSIPDVLSPNTTSTSISSGSSRRRGRPRKNQSDPKVEKGYEGTSSSKRKMGSGSCKNEKEGETGDDSQNLSERAKRSRKRDSLREKDPKKCRVAKDYGEEMVGSKVRIWWPLDRKFYVGEISSFDPKLKKHKITYTDGEIEHLNLVLERWELIDEEDLDSAEEEEHVTGFTPEASTVAREVQVKGSAKKKESDASPLKRSEMKGRRSGRKPTTSTGNKLSDKVISK